MAYDDWYSYDTGDSGSSYFDPNYEDLGQPVSIDPVTIGATPGLNETDLGTDGGIDLPDGSTKYIDPNGDYRIVDKHGGTTYFKPDGTEQDAGGTDGGGGGGAGTDPAAPKGVMEEIWNFAKTLVPKDANGNYDITKLIGAAGMLTKLLNPPEKTPKPVTGYQGGIPELVMNRAAVPQAAEPSMDKGLSLEGLQAGRRPGSAGPLPFTGAVFSRPEDSAGIMEQLNKQAQGIAVANPVTAENRQQDGSGYGMRGGAGGTSATNLYDAKNPAHQKSATDFSNHLFELINTGQEDKARQAYNDAQRTFKFTDADFAPFAVNKRDPNKENYGLTQIDQWKNNKTNATRFGYAAGGIADLGHENTFTMEEGEPRYLRGETDGMADELPAMINGKQPAALAHGEFVIPADVVSHIGNGNSDAGAKKLYQTMAKIRKARTGNPKQGKEIDADKHLAFATGGIINLPQPPVAPTYTVKHFAGGGFASADDEKNFNAYIKTNPALAYSIGTKSGMSKDDLKNYVLTNKLTTGDGKAINEADISHVFNTTKLTANGDIDTAASSAGTGAGGTAGSTATVGTPAATGLNPMTQTGAPETSSLSKWAGPAVTNAIGKGIAVGNDMMADPSKYVYQGQRTAGLSDLQTQAMGQASTFKVDPSVNNSQLGITGLTGKIGNMKYDGKDQTSQYTKADKYDAKDQASQYTKADAFNPTTFQNTYTPQAEYKGDKVNSQYTSTGPYAGEKVSSDFKVGDKYVGERATNEYKGPDPYGAQTTKSTYQMGDKFSGEKATNQFDMGEKYVGQDQASTYKAAPEYKAREAVAGYTATGPYQAQQVNSLYNGLGQYDAAKFTTKDFTGDEVSKYTNPYLQQSLDPQLAEARRQAEISRITNSSRLVGAGAFGGGRQAVMEAEGDRNLQQQLAAITGKGYDTAYNTARDQFNTSNKDSESMQKNTEASRQFGANLGLQDRANAATFGYKALDSTEASRQFAANQALQNATNQATFYNQAESRGQADRQQAAQLAAQQAQYAAQAAQAAADANRQERQLAAQLDAQNRANAANYGQQAFNANNQNAQFGATLNQQDRAGAASADAQAAQTSQQDRQFAQTSGIQNALNSSNAGIAALNANNQNAQFGANLDYQNRNTAAGLGLQAANINQQDRQFGANQAMQNATNSANFGQQAAALNQNDRQFGANYGMTNATNTANFGQRANEATQQSQQFGANFGMNNNVNAANFGQQAVNANNQNAQFGANYGMTNNVNAANFGQQAINANNQNNQFGANFGLSAANAGIAGLNTAANLGLQSGSQQLQGINALAGLGATQQATQQAGLTADMTKFNQTAALPGQAVQYQLGLFNGMPITNNAG